jgi:AcrR family transcriptional regulator
MIIYKFRMGRRKTVSDQALLDGLLAALERAGPDAFSFAKASGAVGLSPATLVQRFGSRDAMIEAILLHAWDRLDAATALANAETSPDPAGAVAMLLRLIPAAAIDGDVADGLLLLREDIKNPALRARGRAWGAYLAKALGARLTDQLQVAERLGWQMASLWQGAIIWSAFRRSADSEAEIRAMLENWCASIGGVRA